MKKLIFSIAFLLSAALPSFAEPKLPTELLLLVRPKPLRFAGDVMATTCSQPDVQAAIDAAVGGATSFADGDRVVIPNGTCTWTASDATQAGVDVGTGSGSSTKHITIYGAGTCSGCGVTDGGASHGANGTWSGGPEITLTCVTTCDGKWFNKESFNNWAGVDVKSAINLRDTKSRVTGIKFIFADVVSTVSGDPDYAINAQGNGYRIDNMSFDNPIATGQSNRYCVFVRRKLSPTTDAPEGVIDHNYFHNCRVVSHLGTVNANQNLAHSQVLNFGLAQGATDTMYVEDNTSIRDTSIFGDFTDVEYSGRIVVRYNYIANGTAEVHSVHQGTGGYRGARAYENYGNYFECTTATSNCGSQGPIWLRAGSGIVYNNTIVKPNGRSLIWDVGLNNVRSEGNEAVPNPPSSYGQCDGTHVAGGSPPNARIDGNTLATGWPCLDQIGRGQDASQFTGVIGTNDMPLQASVPYYFWNNTRINGSTPTSALTFTRQNCLSTVKPTGSCLDIVAGRDFVHPTSSPAAVSTGLDASKVTPCTEDSGYWATDTLTLYKCTSLAWAEHWKEFTYPHPLVDNVTPFPTLTSITPNSGNRNGTTSVDFVGTGFSAGNVAVSVSGTGVTPGTPSSVTDTTMSSDFVITAGATLGARNVTVTTDSGTSNGQTFTVVGSTAPTLSSVLPILGYQDTTVTATMTGTAFDGGNAVVAVSGTGVTVQSCNVAATIITCQFVISSSALGVARTVTVTTDGGTSDGFTFTVVSKNEGTRAGLLFK